MALGNIIKFFMQNPVLIYIGGIITNWGINKILDKLPNYIKYEFRYNIKSLTKWLLNSPINVLFNYKIMNISIALDDYEKEIKNFMKKNSFKFESQKGNDYIYSYKFGSINPELNLSPSYEIIKESKDVSKTNVCCIEISIKIKTGFKSFKDDINETDKLKQQLNTLFREKYGELNLDSTIFNLPNMYKLTGILKDLNLKYLYGQLGENKIDLYDNKIIVYDTILTRELINIKKIITYYY